MTKNKSFTSNKPLAYLIATPIGNLKEFSDRAKQAVLECDLVACEDTRNTSSLLSKFNISKPTFSLREHNEKSASETLISKIKNGTKVVYMSDAGYPGISDPGSIFVKECIANDINISIINGSSAFLSCLLASGLDTSHFYFYGFLSPKNNEATKELNSLKDREETLIFYEAPHRIKETLEVMYKVLGNRDAVIGRELTKLNEEFIRGTLEELSTSDESQLIGEMVIVVEGNKTKEELPMDEINESINLLKSKGLSNRDIVEIISKIYKVNKNQISKILY